MIKIFIYVLLVLLTVTSCLEPYNVNISGYENLLVVDALITNENKSHKVVLSRSTTNINEESIMETGAIVKIIDKQAVEEVLFEIRPGEYVTDSTSFIAKSGYTYQLSVETLDGSVYMSTPCEMLPVTQISRIYYEKDKNWDADEIYENDGISVYVNGITKKDTYVRWTFEEDWKFKVPYAQKYIYNEQNDLEAITPKNVFCWKKNISNNISVGSYQNQENPKIKKKRIVFVPTKLTDKTSMRYSILVKQITISSDEYTFWTKLKKSTEDVGDVFGKQPFSIAGNISNIADKREPVLGYFQVGNVVSERLYINRSEIVDLELPIFSAVGGCKLKTVEVDGIAFFSAFEIYLALVASGQYALYEPILANSSAVGLLLTSHGCSDCTFSGTVEKPDFWED